MRYGVDQAGRERPMAEVTLVEVAPRDGIQNEPTILDRAMKQALIGKLVAAGLRRIEVTSFVNPKRVPQMAGAGDLVSALRDDPAMAVAKPSLSALALNLRGAREAIAAGVDEVTYVVVASETFNQRNQGVPIAETLAQWRDVRAAAREAGCMTSLTIAAAFGCPFEGEVDPGRPAAIAAELAAADALPDEIALADTIGVAAPGDVATRFALLREALPDLPLRAHFHNTRNTGLANAVTAIASGVTALDASVGGFGGCPFAPAATGNVPSEDLTYMLQRMGHLGGIDLDALIATGNWLGEQLGKQPPALLGRAGAFPGNLGKAA